MINIKIITGATATGKTKRAIEVAKNCNGEIINCDCLQCYNDLKILTAYPSNNELSEINHRLLGYLNYDTPTSAVSWAQLASIAIKDIIYSGKTPIIVGGTGLYLKTLCEGISPIPNISETNRKKAIELANENFETMYNELYTIDSELKTILPSSKHHQIIRSYEIFLETGKSIRYFWEQPKVKFIENVNFDYEIMQCNRSELYNRIEKRFDQMLKNGAIEEVQELLRKIQECDRQKIFLQYPIFKAIGAKEITLFLDGIYSFSQMREISIKNSRHYAKRQITWFNHQIVTI